MKDPAQFAWEHVGVPMGMEGVRDQLNVIQQRLARGVAARDAEIRAAAFEEAARLHEQVRTICDHEPGAGGGAMGAVIDYRDKIRASAKR